LVPAIPPDDPPPSAVVVAVVVVVIGNTPDFANGDVFADDVFEFGAVDVGVGVADVDVDVDACAGREVTMKPLFSLLAESAELDSLIMDVGGGDGERDRECWDCARGETVDEAGLDDVVEAVEDEEAAAAAAATLEAIDRWDVPPPPPPPPTPTDDEVEGNDGTDVVGGDGVVNLAGEGNLYSSAIRAPSSPRSSYLWTAAPAPPRSWVCRPFAVVAAPESDWTPAGKHAALAVDGVRNVFALELESIEWCPGPSPVGPPPPPPCPVAPPPPPEEDSEENANDRMGEGCLRLDEATAPTACTLALPFVVVCMAALSSSSGCPRVPTCDDDDEEGEDEPRLRPKSALVAARSMK